MTLWDAQVVVSKWDDGGPHLFKAASGAISRKVNRVRAPSGLTPSHCEPRSGPFFKEDKYHLKKEDI